MRLLVLTSSDHVKDEHDVIRQLFRAGLKTLHVRKPSFTSAQMTEYLKQFPERYRSRLVLHSHHGLAVRFKLKGIHLTEKDRKSVLKMWKCFYYYKLRKPKLRISTSLHKTEEINKLGHKYDYVFLSPVFQSISKENHKPKFSLSRLQEAVKTAKYKVFALGGIDESKISTCKELGFKGVGLLGSIWMDNKPVERFKVIKELCREGKGQF